jgi:hypothetical protein
VDVGWFHIVGEVQNNSDTPVAFVKVVATLYDDAGQVVGTDFTYTEIDLIPPGGKSPFETGTDEWTGTTNYKLKFKGMRHLAATGHCDPQPFPYWWWPQ